jgi:hypothetical protein
MPTQHSSWRSVSIDPAAGLGSTELVRPGIYSFVLRILVALMFAHATSQSLADSRNATPDFDPARAKWTDLEFTASKFFLSASATLSVRSQPSADITHALLDTPTGPRPLLPAGAAAQLRYTATGAGADADVTLWLDSQTGAALQTRQLNKGSHPKLRVDRYAATGIYQLTRRPVDDAEQEHPPDGWSDKSDASRAYPEAVAGRPVLEPTSLLWLLAISKLERPGDRLEVLAYSRRHVNRVTAEVLGMKSVRVDYREVSGEGAGARERRRQGRMQALRIRIAGTNIAPEAQEASDENDFELLGLRGDSELLLDPTSRAPLELRGRAKIIGEIALRIRSARITS